MKNNLFKNVFGISLSAILIGSMSLTYAASPDVHYKSSGLYANAAIFKNDSTGCGFSDSGISLWEAKQLVEKGSPDFSGPSGAIYINENDWCSENGPGFRRWSFAEIKEGSISLAKNLSKASIVADTVLETHEWILAEDVDNPGSFYWQDVVVSQENVHVDVVWTGEGSVDRYNNRNFSRWGNTTMRSDYKGQYRNAAVVGSIVGTLTNIQIDTSVINENASSSGSLGSTTNGYFQITH